MIHYKRTGNFRSGKFGFVWQLPVLKIAKYFEYLEELANILTEKKDLKSLKKEVTQVFSNDSNLSEVRNWQVEDVLNKFSSHAFTEGSSKLFENLWKSYNDQDQGDLLKIIDKKNC